MSDNPNFREFYDFPNKPRADLCGKCPSCEYEQICPCENCETRRDNTDIKPYIHGEGDTIRCANCGHSGHVDYWMDWYYECSQLQKGE